MEVNSDAVRTNIALEPGMLGPGQNLLGPCQNRVKLEVVKQEMARVNIGILRISELNGQKWANLIQMTIMSATVGKNPLEEVENPSWSTGV